MYSLKKEGQKASISSGVCRDCHTAANKTSVLSFVSQIIQFFHSCSLLGHLDALLRGLVLGKLGKAGHKATLEEARRRFKEHVEGKHILSADLRSPVGPGRAFWGPQKSVLTPLAGVFQRVGNEREAEWEMGTLRMGIPLFVILVFFHSWNCQNHPEIEENMKELKHLSNPELKLPGESSAGASRCRNSDPIPYNSLHFQKLW